MRQPYDAVIVGAGPAGLSAAIELLLKGWSVLILDREKLPRAKVCGGFVGPENLEQLEKYGVLEKMLSRGALKVSHICLSAANGASVRIPITLGGKPAAGLGVSRKLFDSALLEKAMSLGASVLDAVNLLRVEEGDLLGLAVRHAKERKVELIKTRHLIYATGSRKQNGSSAAADYFGVSAMFQDVIAIKDDVFLHFMDKGHLGINRFENGVTNVCFVADKNLFGSVKGDVEKLFQIYIRENAYAARQLSAANRVTPWQGIPIPRPTAPEFQRGRAFCCGDAVDSIHPVAGAGISLALSGGAMLGELLGRSNPGDVSFQKVSREYENEWKRMFYLRVKLSRVWGAWGHKPFVANNMMKLFSLHSRLLDGLYKFHHRPMKRNVNHTAKGTLSRV